MLLQHQTWQEVEAYLARSNGIILPIGSTEQHISRAKPTGNFDRWKQFSNRNYPNADSPGRQRGNVQRKPASEFFVGDISGFGDSECVGNLDG